MNILIPNCPYSDIPRLAKEGKIKVGTRVKACEDQKKYPNGFTRSMQKGVICEIAEVSDGWFRIQHEGIVSMPAPYSQYMDFFLDILEDEEDEPVVIHSPIYLPPKPLSFSEPLTKEAVGRVIYSQHYGKEIIDNLSIDGEWLKVNTGGWGKREHYRDAGWHFESSTDEITIEEAEKLTGKKIKRV